MRVDFFHHWDRSGSEEDFVLLWLDEVIDASRPLVMSVLYACVHEACSIEIIEVLTEAQLQVV